MSQRHSNQVAPSRHTSVCYSSSRDCRILSAGRSINKVFNTCGGEGLTLGAFKFSRWTRKDLRKLFSPPLCYANQYSRAAITNILPKYSSPFVFSEAEQGDAVRVGCGRGRRVFQQRDGGETRLEMQTASGTCP